MKRNILICLYDGGNNPTERKVSNGTEEVAIVEQCPWVGKRRWNPELKIDFRAEHEQIRHNCLRKGELTGLNYG